MSLQRQSLVVDGDGSGGDGGGDDRGGGNNKAARLPRWTRQEILVLIQGKRVAESRVRGRASISSSTAFGSSSSSMTEPKWAAVSSYCKRHGVNRGPVQCRKRWSNLAGDFKKIKEWENNNTDESDSFWVMRNDLRRERKLPGFYDKEVYDTLNDASSNVPAGAGGVGEDIASYSTGLSLALAPIPTPMVARDDDDDDVADEDEDADDYAADDVDIKPTLMSAAKAVVAAAMDVVSTPPIRSIPAPTPISVFADKKLYQQQQSYPPPSPNLYPNKGKTTAVPSSSNPQAGSASQPPPPHEEGRKRKRSSTDDDGDIRQAATLQDQLIQVVEKNGMMLNVQLEAHNKNLELDRQQRNEHTSSLVSVLNKLADVLGKIVEKL